MNSHQARHGYILDQASGEAVDEVVIIPYRAPRTYTGEDLVEINCHGGAVVVSAVLAGCLSAGARLAEPGEFTRRAFMSGRIDLTQAEAVLDLIQAKTGRQGRLALSALSGGLGDEIRGVRDEVAALLTRVVAGIDFPEEVGDLPEDDLAPVVDGAKARLAGLSRTARSGRFLRDGLRVALAGRPNAGKSSLLNRLVQFERAIVTEIPGTTRDSLEELLDVNGVPVILVDTAGIRHTEDAVELIGIDRTRAAVAQSDLVLFIVDLPAGVGGPEADIRKMIGDRPFVAVGNKADLMEGTASGGAYDDDPCRVATVRLSAKTGEGLAELNAAIERFVFAGDKGEARASLNQRQAALCDRAIAALSHVGAALSDGLPQDCLATDLKGALDALSEICGEAVSEEIIHQVFATFCIGK